MMISFKPYGYSREHMVAVVEAMSPPFAFSGLKRRELEDLFCQRTGRRHALAFREPFAPLLYLLKYVGVGQGEKVLLSPLSFQKHFSPYISLLGAEVLYADVERWFMNMDMKRLKSIPLEDVKVLIVSNSLGITADWLELSELIKNKNVFVIEDSRETIFTEYVGRPAGSSGDVSILGFSEGSIIKGYGSIFLMDDERLYGRMKDCAEPLDDITSSLILSQMGDLEERMKVRERLAELYSRFLLNIEGIKAQFVPKYVSKMCWSYFCVHLGKRYSTEARGIVSQLLMDDNVQVVEYPLSQDILEGRIQKHLHIAHEVSSRALLLPFHEHMDEEDVYFVCERLKEHVVQVGAGSIDH